MAEFTMRRSSTRNSKVPNQYRDFVCSLNSENKGFSVAKENRGVESGESSVNKGIVNENNNGVEIPVEVTVGSSGEGGNGEGVVHSVNRSDCVELVMSVNCDRQEDQVDNEIGSKNNVNVTIEDSRCKNNMNGNNKPNSDVTKNSFSYVTSSNVVKVENKLMEIPTEVDSDGNKLVIFDEELFVVDNKRLKDVIDNGNGIYLFKFNKEEGMKIMLDNGPWLVNNKPLVASKGFARVLIEVNAEKDLPNKIDVAYKNKLNEIIGTKIVHVSEQAMNNEGNKSSKVSDGFTEVINRKGGNENVINENNIDPKQFHGGCTRKNKNAVTKEQMKGMGPKLNSGGNTPKSNKDAAKKGTNRNMNQFDVLRVHDEEEQPNLNISNGMEKVSREGDIEKDDVFMGQSGVAVSMEKNEVIGMCISDKQKEVSKFIAEDRLQNRNLVTVRCINMTDQAILCIIEDVNSHLVSFSSFIYAANGNIERMKLWAELHRHKQITNGVYFINNDMKEFRDCVNMIEVEDLCNSGLFFTWTKNLKNVKKGLDTGVLKKLDRVMFNEDFVNCFDKAHVIFKPYLVSDHSQAVVIILNGMEKKKRAFKFANYIADKDNFLPTVDAEWKKHVVEGLRNKVKSIQSMIDKDPHNKALRESEVVILKDYLIAMEDEEKLIESVQDVNGNRFEGQDVAVQFVNHFQSFLGQSSKVHDINDYATLFSKKLSKEEAISMVNEVTSKKIKDVLFGIGDNRASGSDDNLLVMCHGDVDFVKVVRDSIDEFGKSSGMLPNFSKSTIFLEVWKIRFSLRFYLSCLLRRLIASILESIQVYWCTVFLLPKVVLKDIDNLLSGFLWCNGELSKGKAKIVWKKICKPKAQGGFLMGEVDQYCQVKWEEFLEANAENNDSRGWKNLLDIRNEIDSSVWYKVGNGKNTSIWFDNWCDLGPLFRIISNRSLYSAGLQRNMLVADMISEVQGKLMTCDRMTKWGSYDVNLCTLCKGNSESHDHLFFNCEFSGAIWEVVKEMMQFQSGATNWVEIIDELADKQNGNSIWSIVRRLCLAVIVYAIWRERNSRIFRKEACSWEVVLEKICETVRLKLMGLKVKNTVVVQLLLGMDLSVNTSFTFYLVMPPIRASKVHTVDPRLDDWTALLFLWHSCPCFRDVLITGLSEVNGGGECGMANPEIESYKLVSCASATQNENATVSRRCCAQVKRLGKKPQCLCAVMLTYIAKRPGIRPDDEV
ncbi:RNA-directed DNA polymerase, eukaryota, reverse transcriptase zinc-binding domain protein [Tanacetum coccineum]|uniref:RNA-directed DNA polymerase, eukaryota, reverse transcriptase zinc-binding domain protein n=1 Tax=Tanacetum coccineum TaxID=301880 RepID=A0ABQ5BWK8_9ASTR